jgi:radical SAM superfamily enzyme YgiQ (UPF0313 family)
MTSKGFPDHPWAAGCDVLLVEDLSQQRLPARALAAVLQQAGFGVRLVHYGPGRPDDEEMRAIATLTEQLQPRLVLLSILFASRVSESLALAAALRRAGVRAHITMAGPLPSFTPAELLAASPELDSVLCGEAEVTAAELVRVLEDPVRWSAVPGMAYRAHGGTIRLAATWPAPVADLDSLPFPLHEGVLPCYLGHRFVTVEGSRGCYHSCSFCLPTAFYRAAARGSGPVDGRLDYRLRSVRNLVDEIETLYRQGARLFLFDDEQFLPPRPLRAGRITQLEQELARRNLEIAFTIKCRADDVEVDLFRQLQRMGLLRVYVGVESGCQASLDLFGKGVTSERNLEALATLANLAIVADFYDLLFHPWSTLETVEADIAFCRRSASLICTPLRFGEVGVLPGTGVAERLRAEGRCCGEPWSYTYELADPRVEVLRRMCHLVFTASGSRRHAEQTLTEAWYAILLERRFKPSRSNEATAGKLKEAVAVLNGEWLALWSEMLEFARSGPIRDAEQVNDAAGRWATCVNSGCMRAAGTLAELGLPTRTGLETEVVPLC